MSTDTIDLLIELAENEGSSHYGDACREAVAALTAAAERETTLRAKLDKVVDCFRHMDSNLTNTPWADITPELVMQRAWAVLREENDAKTTAEAEVERLNGALAEFNKFVDAYIAYPHNGSEISQGRQSGLIDVRDKLVALGLTPDPPREK